MNAVQKKLERCVASVKEKVHFKPEIAIVLGSGLGSYAEEIQVEETLDYSEIEGFPMSTVAGHKGRFVFGYAGEAPVVVMQGRVHYYEGYSAPEISRILGKNVNTIYTWLTRSKGLLRERLEEE